MWLALTLSLRSALLRFLEPVAVCFDLHHFRAVRYELAERRKSRVSIDYHVEFEGRYYSAPYRLVHEHVEVRSTVNVVEIFLSGERVATHQRSYAPRGTALTEAAHRPEQHRDQTWPPERMIENVRGGAYYDRKETVH